MASLSSVFWILGFILSVVIAPQARMWTWGPTMLCFGAAALAALPVLFRKDLGREALYVLIPGVATAAWIAARALFSPVAELAVKDLLLVVMAVSTFIVFRAAGGGAVSGKLLVGGIALILGASLWVIARQIADPSFSPVFPAGDKSFIRGFFGHYSYCASFLIPTSLLLAGLALHGRLHGVFRVLLLALSVAGLVAVVYTKSRGGVLGAGLGLTALALGSVLIGKREGKRWFVPVAILAPLALIGAAVFFLNVLEGVQESRSYAGDGDLTGMLDNTIRLYMLGMAVTCIIWHPWLGGGSRSYSWESFQAWDVSAYGHGNVRPEHVHNELVQTFSEYGIVGGLLLLVFIGGVVIAAFAGTLFKDRAVGSGLSDGWRVGGLAGLIGLFVQSQFEGIFRLPPGAILLGLCLAAASVAMAKPLESRCGSAANRLLAVCALLTMIPLFAYGWKATKAMPALWPAYFSHIPPGTEARIDALSGGIAVWPMNQLHQRRGALYRELAADGKLSEEERRGILELALADFRSASEFHHFDPENPLNMAGTLMLLGRDAEAEPFYRKAVKAQGNMEATFHANHRFAIFLLGRGAVESHRGDIRSAIATLRLAARHIDKAFELGRGHSLGAEGHALRAGIRSALGQALEAEGDHRGAMEQYDQATALPQGTGAHYLAGRLLGKRAVVAWGERRSEDALRLFIDAEARVVKAKPLPQGVTPVKRDEYLAYLRKTIAFLRGAKVVPSEKMDF